MFLPVFAFLVLTERLLHGSAAVVVKSTNN
jgi:hypothetical protein